jgi:pantoate--beta-alanine ligase
MSSRNSYLSPDERRAAPILHRTLTEAKTAYEKGERSGDALRQAMLAALEAEPLAQTDYVSIAQPDTLAELDTVNRDALFSLAVRIGKTRLIDNFILSESNWLTGK